MGLTIGAEYSYAGLNLKGISLSGIRTAISLPDYSFSFDVAQGYPFLLNLKQFFLSHGHLDHAAGVPYIISQKAMNNQEAPKFYMPKSLVEPLDRIMKIWQEIEGHQYKYEFIGVEADMEIPVKGNHFVKVFPTTHRIDSFGYTLFENHKKLAPKYQGLSRDELMKLRNEGHDLNEVTAVPLVSQCAEIQRIAFGLPIACAIAAQVRVVSLVSSAIIGLPWAKKIVGRRARALMPRLPFGSSWRPRRRDSAAPASG